MNDLPLPTPVNDLVSVPVRLMATDHMGYGLRPVVFRRLPGYWFGSTGARWASDAIVAMRYGSGRTIYPRAIVLTADPRHLLDNGALTIAPRFFARFVGAEPRPLGWIRRRGVDAAGWEPTAAAVHHDRDWVSVPPDRPLSPDPWGSHRIGRFTVRTVKPGGALYSGLTGGPDRTPSAWESRHAIIEIYDPRHRHTPLGQFVAAYTAANLVEDDRAHSRLALVGGIEAWTMTVEETTALRDLARQVDRD